MSAHTLINGLSIGSGGGYTVGRELFRHLAEMRPQTRLTLALIERHPLHEQMRAMPLPVNCGFVWAPPNAVNRVARLRYQSGALVRWAMAEGVDRVLQLNGMIIPNLRIPTLCHNQDPWPYRPEAWNGRTDALVAYFKRRAQARAIRDAACVGWTSAYLRDLIAARLGFVPRCSEVFHNGLPDEWLNRAREPLPDWSSRPLELLSVSNVDPYKRQDLVIRAMPDLIRRPGLAGLTYRIVGAVTPAYARSLDALAARLNVGDRVFVEGRVSDERVREFYATAKCFVLMSVCESFGIPAIEAMSFGVPVVVSDCCAMPEVCGSAASLSPVDDIGALVDRVTAVLTDPVRAEQMRLDGARQIQRYRWRETAARMADRLDTLGNT